MSIFDYAPSLAHDIEQSGYYPALVLDVLGLALADEDVADHLVHVETTFVHGQVQRHVTVLALTASRLVLAHVDDHPADDKGQQASAAATTECIALSTITSIATTFGVQRPESHQPGVTPQDLTLAICWGAVRRIDVAPADCGDPQCTAEHGMSGTITPDDVVIRVSAQAEGEAAVRRAVRFATSLARATAQYAHSTIRTRA